MEASTAHGAAEKNTPAGWRTTNGSSRRWKCRPRGAPARPRLARPAAWGVVLTVLGCFSIAHEARADASSVPGLGGVEAAYAPDLALDRALEERARAAGVTVSAGAVRIGEERAALEVEARTGRKIADLEALLDAAGIPRGVLADAIARKAWRRATAAALIRATRRPTEEELRRDFERRYGPGGITRTYREVLVSTDPLVSRLYTAEDLARDTPLFRARAREAAERLAREIEGGRARVDDAAASGATVVEIGLAGLQPEAAGGEILAAPTGTAVIVERPEEIRLGVVTRRVASERLEGVRVAILPRPGEGAAALRERADEAAATLAGAAAEDLEAVAVSLTDDDEERARGARFTVATAARGPLVEALEPLRPGEVTPPVPWRGGVLLARLVARQPTPGGPRVEGRLAVWRFDPVSVRLAAFGPRVEGLAREKAQRLLERAWRGESLAALALAESDDARSRARGGLVEGISPSADGAEFARAAAALPVGGEPRLLEGRRGLHVIRCEGERRVRYEDVRAELVAAARGRPVSDAECDALITEVGREVRRGR